MTKDVEKLVSKLLEGEKPLTEQRSRKPAGEGGEDFRNYPEFPDELIPAYRTLEKAYELLAEVELPDPELQEWVNRSLKGTDQALGWLCNLKTSTFRKTGADKETT